MIRIEFESGHNLIGGAIQKLAWNEKEKITKEKETSVKVHGLKDSQGTWSEGQSRYMVWRTVKVHGLKDSILSQDPCKQRSAMDPTVTFSSSLNKVQLHETDKLTSTTSVLAYLTQTASVGMYTWITNTGLGGRPWPSHKRLSQANEISQRGSSDGSDKDKDNGTEGVICVNYT